MRTTTTAWALLLLAGCATQTTHWEQGGAPVTRDQLGHDQMQCKQYAMAMFLSFDEDSCMKTLGYYRVPDTK
jgi:hypothetical protein